MTEELLDRLAIQLPPDLTRELFTAIAEDSKKAQAFDILKRELNLFTGTNQRLYFDKTEEPYGGTTDSVYIDSKEDFALLKEVIANDTDRAKTNR